MSSPYAQGRQVHLRPIGMPDAPLFVRWMNDPDVTRYLARVLPMTMEEEQEWIRKRAEDRSSLVLMIVASPDDAPIGSVGLHAISYLNRRATFGIQIGEREYWNRGFGSEATELMLEIGFERLNLNRVELDVYETNQRAIHVYERAGFRTEGIARQARFWNGRYEDIRRMAVLAEEWRANRSLVAGEVCQT